MNINIPPKSDDPQRLLALANVPREFWLSAIEINNIVDVLAFLLGQRSTLYLGEFETLYKLELAHPDPAPGSYAQIISNDPEQANQKAEWDNTLKKWEITGDYDYPTTSEGNSQTRLDSLIVGWSSGYTYEPRAFFTIDNVPYTDTRSFTLVPDELLDKICTFVVNIETRKIEVLEGDPAEDPVEPSIDYTKYLQGPFVYVKTGTAQPENVEVINVYQENAGTAGGEFNPGGGVDFDFANADAPAKGNVAIKSVGTIQTNQVLLFDAGEDLQVSNVKEFHFKIKNIVAGDFYARIRGKNSSGRATSFILPDPKDYGYDPNNITDYQKVILPVNQTGLETFNQINLTSQNKDWRFFIDDVYFVGGEGTPAPENNNYVRFSDLQNYMLKDLSNLISNLSEAQKTEIKNKLGIVEGGSGGSYTPPSPYGTMQAMYDDQANQVANQTYRVTDASGHSEVNAGRAWFEYKGTLNAAEGDYILKGEEESLNLDQQFDALQQQITANANNITDLKKPVITIATSRLLNETDNRRKLLITANVTLTWPAGGIADFHVNWDIDAGGQLTIADEAATPGDDIDAEGTILEAGKMGHGYSRPDNGKLRLKGDWI